MPLLDAPTRVFLSSIVIPTREITYGGKNSLRMLDEARTGARARASPCMLSEYLDPYGTSLAELTITTIVLLHLKTTFYCFEHCGFEIMAKKCQFTNLIVKSSTPTVLNVVVADRSSIQAIY
jgi:hypothetical protein